MKCTYNVTVRHIRIVAFWSVRLIRAVLILQSNVPVLKRNNFATSSHSTHSYFCVFTNIHRIKTGLVHGLLYRYSARSWPTVYIQCSFMTHSIGTTLIHCPPYTYRARSWPTVYQHSSFMAYCIAPLNRS